ncbi:hypothetical protein ASZ78_001984 [Callipepla squamata]|uniref:heme oxygenase (biliverdin-producing) n=1 Tax=Callipepla squamata TaxID=9009 RepID=A0A226MK37_CALSU|nr:hypothetical protein ASZ78_001984 [Callipepla squamata]
MSQDLSELLKEATKEVHEQAENTPFMRNFQKGQVSLHEFKLVTASLYFIYSALEEEIERNKDNPVYAPVYFPAELHRKAALEKDLEYFYGSNWRAEIPCPEATQKYVERLHYVGKNHPELLVAHAYTRYLGDLSGGQVFEALQKLVSTSQENGHAVQSKAELRTRNVNKLHENGPAAGKENERTSRTQADMLTTSPLVQWILALGFIATTVALGLFAM